MVRGGHEQDPQTSPHEPPHPGTHYTPDLCRSHIEHAQKFCDIFIEEDPLLSGNIHNLQAKNEELSENELIERDLDIEQEPEECRDTTDIYFEGHDPLEEDERREWEELESGAEEEEDEQKSE